jgi:hypothetical protein
MSYFSSTEEQSLGGWLGCGPGCSCGPCRSGMSGLGERYELDVDEEPVSASAASSRPASLNGWYGAGLSYYGFDETEAPAPSVPETPTPQTTVPGPEAPPAVAPPSGGPPAGLPAAAAPTTEAPLPSAPAPSAPPSSPEAEEELIQDALRSGVRNPWQLTDIIFFARHPSRKGTLIKPDETELISERRHIRLKIVLPALRQLIRLRTVPFRPRIVRPPRRIRRGGGFGFAGLPAAPVCGAARADLATIAGDLTLVNNELAKGAGASRHRLDLKRKLLDLDVNGMITSLDSYIVSGCCEPSLKTLESEVLALPWHVSVDPMRARLLREIAAAQGRARKDFKHC